MNINITSTDEFIQALRENPEFLAAARRELLTQELLDLPDAFASYSKRTDKWFNRIDREFRQVKGIFFGGSIDRAGLPRMVSEFGLRRTRVVRLAENNRASEDFNDAVWDALDNGTITRGQYDRLMVTDIVVRGRPGQSTDDYAYIVAEASYTLEQDDLEKVQASRDIIRKVFPGAAVFACLYGSGIPDDVRTSAEGEDVKIFIDDV